MTTTYTYSLTSPSWTDPTGTYLVTLDKYDSQVARDDPPWCVYRPLSGTRGGCW